MGSSYSGIFWPWSTWLIGVQRGVLFSQMQLVTEFGREEDSFVCLLFLITWFSPGPTTFEMKGMGAGSQSHICFRCPVRLTHTQNRSLGSHRVQLVDGFPSCTQSPGFISSTECNPSVMTSVCNSSSWEAEAGGCGVQGILGCIATLRLGVELDPRSSEGSKSACRVW